jgi:hypothetical protein
MLLSDVAHAILVGALAHLGLCISSTEILCKIGISSESRVSALKLVFILGANSMVNVVMVIAAMLLDFYGALLSCCWGLFVIDCLLTLAVLIKIGKLLVNVMPYNLYRNQRSRKEKSRKRRGKSEGPQSKRQKMGRFNLLKTFEISTLKHETGLLYKVVQKGTTRFPFKGESSFY